MNCEKCNAEMIGDGYTSVLHCGNADPIEYEHHEPDAFPVFCDFEEEDKK